MPTRLSRFRSRIRRTSDVFEQHERSTEITQGLQEHGFERHERTWITQGPWEARAPALYDLVQELAQGKLGRFATLYLTKFVGHEINAKGDELEGWKRDFQLAVEP